MSLTWLLKKIDKRVGERQQKKRSGIPVIDRSLNHILIERKYKKKKTVELAQMATTLFQKIFKKKKKKKPPPSPLMENTRL